MFGIVVVVVADYRSETDILGLGTGLRTSKKAAS